jgi:RimJ/RimL family protein N-acetyltransferase
MFELDQSQFTTVKSFALNDMCDKVYPISIVEGNQKGRIFVDDINYTNAVLFWHFCGFGNLVGNPPQDFLLDIVKLIKNEYEENQTRFVLHLNNTDLEPFFANIDGIEQLLAYRFKYNKDKSTSYALNTNIDYNIKEVNSNILEHLQGRIIPSFSWSSNSEFIHKGKGYCVMHGNEVASISFTSAIGGTQIDIGVETNDKYKEQGLAKVVASKMVKYVLSKGYEPVWECDSKNIASKLVAESIGFEITASHSVFRKI